MKLRKVISGILVVCLMVLFASCDAASILKIGETMGKTENNVYGLKPNMAAVGEVAETVGASVGKNEDGTIKQTTVTVTVTNEDGTKSEVTKQVADIDLTEAAKVQDVVAEIGNSTTKKDELRKEMKKPVAETPEEKALVKAALEVGKQAVVDKAKEAIDHISEASIPEEVKTALDTVVTNIASIPVSDDPSQAELVSVAVVNQLAETLEKTITELPEGAELNDETLVEVYNKAVGAVETIKTVNDNEFDLLQGIDIAGLLGMAGGGAKGLEDLDEPQKTMATDAINSLLAAIDGNHNGEITKAEFQSFVGYMSFIRTVYETGAYAFRPFQFSIDNAGLKHGFEGVGEFLSSEAARQDFTINDIPVYLVSALLTEGEKLIKAVNPAIDLVNAELANGIKKMGIPGLDDAAISALGLDHLIQPLPYDSLYDILKLGDADKIVEAFEGFQKVFSPELAEEISSALSSEMVGLLKGALDEAGGNLPKATIGGYAGVTDINDEAAVKMGMLVVEMRIAHILNTAIVMAHEARFAEPIMKLAMPQDEDPKFDDVIDGWFSGIEKGIQGR